MSPDPTPVSPERTPPVAIVTGGARRVGAAIVERLHQAGYDVVIHYRGSQDAAQALAQRLEAHRTGSTSLFALDLVDWQQAPELVAHALARFGRLDLLVNNASLFYPTPLAECTALDWERLVNSNLRAPFELCRAATPHLRARRGAIVNITDIHAERPMAGYPIYNIAKAGLAQLTRALAIDLAPEVRVNAVAPGPIEWPDDGQIDADDRARILAHVPLGREGGAAQIATAVHYLACEADYVTGVTLNVDGGRSVKL
jgi:pteridine reductase